MMISGESNVFPSELVYLIITWSRSSSTTASSRIGTKVGEPPGRLTQIFRACISAVVSVVVVVVPGAWLF